MEEEELAKSDIERQMQHTQRFDGSGVIEEEELHPEPELTESEAALAAQDLKSFMEPVEPEPEPEPEAPEPRSKIPFRTIICDDCVVRIGIKVEDGKITDEGEEVRVHEGEWVKFIPISTIRQHIYLQRLMGFTHATADKTEGALVALVKELSERIIAWNWTDILYEELPQPHKNPAAFAKLSESELVYLIRALTETVGQRKNAGSASPKK